MYPTFCIAYFFQMTVTMKRPYTNISSSLLSKLVTFTAVASAASRDMQNGQVMNSRRAQASRHTQLTTLYSGTIESTHGVSFQLQNTADSSLILSGLGLNVQASPSTVTGAGMIAGDEGPCRVKVYTRSTDGEYGLALDTSSVTCMGPEEETLVTDKMFLKYHEEMYSGHELVEWKDQNRRILQGGVYPLVIEPGSRLEVYIVILPVDEDASGIKPILLSSTGECFEFCSM